MKAKTNADGASRGTGCSPWTTTRRREGRSIVLRRRRAPPGDAERTRGAGPPMMISVMTVRIEAFTSTRTTMRDPPELRATLAWTDPPPGPRRSRRGPRRSSTTSTSRSSRSLASIPPIQISNRNQMMTIRMQMRSPILGRVGERTTRTHRISQRTAGGRRETAPTTWRGYECAWVGVGRSAAKARRVSRSRRRARRSLDPAGRSERAAVRARGHGSWAGGRRGCSLG